MRPLIDYNMLPKNFDDFAKQMGNGGEPDSDSDVEVATFDFGKMNESMGKQSSSNKARQLPRLKD